MLGRDHVLLHSSVALPQCDYVALGHIHRHQILGRDPMVVYAGALERVDFGEQNDTKGFCVVELDATKVQGHRLTNFEFKPVSARNMVTVNVEVNQTDVNPTATVINAIGSHDIQDGIVRVKIKIPSHLEGHLQDSEIRRALEKAHYIAAISKESQTQNAPRVRLGENNEESLSPAAALRAYLATREVSSERAEALMKKAQSIFDAISSEENGS